MFESMTATEWMGVIGAAAWTPHLWLLIKKIVEKPSIQIITSQNVELGYTILGPIFNFHLAFAIQNKDIVATSLQVRIIHEDGDKKVFQWKAVQQNLMEVSAPDGSILPYKKQNSVLAIKLNQKNIEERFVQFQLPPFEAQKDQHEREVLDFISFEQAKDNFSTSTTMESKEMQNLISYIKQQFSWKAGRYSVEIEITSDEAFTVTGDRYEFLLSPQDISKLEANKELIEQHYRTAVFLDHEQGQDENATFPKWNWVNPTLKQIK
ncbi:MAG: hypothetical protein CMF31_01425 [Kordiimonas sp.]|nr:hypothetical protein [Kordiimonas sp.]|tara:strand:+ start:554 stop:1348 length:795 start_codon:yes stop_codon:yes gene_type:complete